MRKFENYVQELKYMVLRETAKSYMDGNLEKEIIKIPERIISDSEPKTTCCVYKERAIISERINMALGGNKENKNIIEVLNIACDRCPVQRYSVTEACRGCLAHKCMEACPFGAIEVINQRARINPDKCKECGKCAQVCPFNAIAEVRRPCIKACKAGAITFDLDTKKARIDDEACIGCGACVYQCPFGAIMDKSYIIDVLKMLKDSKQDNKKVYAIIAPAISNQFTYASVKQVVSGIKKLGFHSVIEAALGADLVIVNEAFEAEKRINEGKALTTSCCPAFVNYIEKKYPMLKDNISDSVSPMIATARLIRKTDKNARIVFIGPCTAKKMEIYKKDFIQDVQIVITFEELQALLDAANINISECEEVELDNASFFGRIFARSGGVTDALKEAFKEYNLKAELKPIVCNELTDCDLALKMLKAGRLDGNFIEGMACEGGCICGPASLSHGPKDKRFVDEYGRESKEKDIKKSVEIFEKYNIKLNIS